SGDALRGFVPSTASNRRLPSASPVTHIETLRSCISAFISATFSSNLNITPVRHRGKFVLRLCVRTINLWEQPLGHNGVMVLEVKAPNKAFNVRWLLLIKELWQ